VTHWVLITDQRYQAWSSGGAALIVYQSISGSNIKLNLVLNVLLSYLKVTIGLPEDTVNDTVDGLKVGISLGTCDWYS